MRGELVIIHPTTGPEVIKLYHSPPSDLVNNLVGGLVQIVPMFDQIATFDGRLLHGLAFCNEEATILKMPENFWATAMWHYVVRAKGEKRLMQLLRGPVVFVSGDAEFMEEL